MATATVSNDFLAALEAAEAPEPIEGGRWSPEVGDFIAGPLLETRTIDTNNGDALLITVDDYRSGPVSLFAGTVIERWFKEKAPVCGEIIGIKYLGKAINKGGNTYKNYVLKLDRQDGSQGALPGTTTAKAAKPPKATNDEDPFAEE